LPSIRIGEKQKGGKTERIRNGKKERKKERKNGGIIPTHASLEKVVTCCR
jgi:hypothetical protein